MKTTAPLLALLSTALFEGADAAGNEEVVLIDTRSIISGDIENRTSYQCTFRNLWTKERQPKNFPSENGRWAEPIMWTHTKQFEPWRANFGVTRGVEKLAEDGFADVLVEEMKSQGQQVKAWSEDAGGGFFVKDKDYVHMPPLETSKQFPFMSVMAGMQPSPDWYTGWYTFWMLDENSNVYLDHIKIQTYPWDAGTDAGVTYNSDIDDIERQDDIQRYRPNNAPPGGELKGPDGDVPVVAEWECFLVVGDEDMIMPDCDWFANPCCNETDKKDCGAVLPNGATPELSPEYEQVLSNSDNAPSGAIQNLSFGAIFAGLAVILLA